MEQEQQPLNDDSIDSESAQIVARKEPKLSIKWRAIFAESAFIGSSILLAFALQDWDEEKDIEERMQIALCNVKSELTFNRVLIQKGYIPVINEDA